VPCLFYQWQKRLEWPGDIACRSPFSPKALHCNHWRRIWGEKEIFGSVMVVGGGIAGMQSALDIANSGYYVYLVEKSSAIGGLMSQLDKTFPTNDCAM